MPYPLIPDTFTYQPGARPNTFHTSASGNDSTWGLYPLGYEHLGYNGSPSDDWILPAVPSDAQLNIYQSREINQPARLTVIVDRDGEHPAGWVDIATGQPPAPLSYVVDPDMLEHTLNVIIPGIALWSTPVHDHTSFLAALRTADELMRDPHQLGVLTALNTPTGLRLPPHDPR